MKMKKLIGLLLVVAMLMGAIGMFAACSESYEIALVTDVGTIDDQSFNQGAWEAVKAYATEKKISYGYYRPSEDSTAARLVSIKNAVTGGAKIIVCPGFLFEEAIYEAQTLYPEVKFVLLDGTPHTADYSVFKTEANVACFLYQEEQAGYLAGYAAVKDGFRKLGFLGGMSVPAVIRYGYGYIQGIDAAAKELNLAKDAVKVNYVYGGQFYGSADITTQMDAWYASGIEVVFACGGGIYSSPVESCAKGEGRYVIGVDTDQGHLSKYIVTSATKGLGVSVKTALEAFYGDKWATVGGKATTLGAINDGIGLGTGFWKLNNFKIADYEAVFAKLKAGTVVVDPQSEAHPVVSNKVVVTYFDDIVKPKA